MTQANFSLHVEQTLAALFDRISAGDTDESLDMDLSDGMLIIECENGIKLILNRQEAVQQIWLATPWEGSHFSFNTENGKWENDKTRADLIASIAEALERASGVKLAL